MEYFGGGTQYRSDAVAKVHYVDLTGQETDYGPVSYTHLDVYKRQVFNPLFGFRLGNASQPGKINQLVHQGIFGVQAPLFRQIPHIAGSCIQGPARPPLSA